MLKWEDLPVEMKSSEVESYYQLVSKRKGSLIFKRCLDWVFGLGCTGSDLSDLSHFEHLDQVG